jgi:hypothetical protein
LDGFAIEGGLHDVPVVSEDEAVSISLGFVDGGDIHAVEDDEAGPEVLENAE